MSRRAQAEAQVLAGMAHPNLVRVIDAGTVDGLVYIVMEKLEGRTLRHALLALGSLTVKEALGVAIQVADGMQLAHQRGVIHRDLKPENIFLEAGSRAKVLDFGVAKVLGASHVTTQKDRLQGTFLYMSPEQLQGVAVTAASDVFALGTMLFEMLYAHPLMLGNNDLRNNEHVAWMQLHRVPPPLETLDKRIPRHVGKLVGRAIVKLPSDRFQTMDAFRDAAAAALRRYEKEAPGEETVRDLSGASSPALRSVALPVPVPVPVRLRPPSGRPKAPARPAGVRGKWVFGLSASFALIALAVAVRPFSVRPKSSAGARVAATVRSSGAPRPPPRTESPQPSVFPSKPTPALGSVGSAGSATAAPTGVLVVPLLAVAPSPRPVALPGLRRAVPRPSSADAGLPAAVRPKPASPRLRETIF